VSWELSWELRWVRSETVQGCRTLVLAMTSLENCSNMIFDLAQERGTELAHQAVVFLLRHRSSRVTMSSLVRARAASCATQRGATVNLTCLGTTASVLTLCSPLTSKLHFVETQFKSRPDYVTNSPAPSPSVVPLSPPTWAPKLWISGVHMHSRRCEDEFPSNWRT
jgi:hypothetical protein